MSEIPQARLEEIASWLRRRVTFEEVLTRLNADDGRVIKPTLSQRVFEFLLTAATGLWIADLYWRIKSGPQRTSADLFNSWYFTYSSPTTELWEYDSGKDSWESLAGENGYALLEEGRIVEFWMYVMN